MSKKEDIKSLQQQSAVPLAWITDHESAAQRDTRYAAYAVILRSCAHTLRLRLLELLEGGEMSVGGLEDQLELDQPIVSQQLARLRAAGLVTSRRDGKAVFYRLADERVLDLLSILRQLAPPK